MKQAGLSDNWSDAADSGAGTSNARPDAEALAVAGKDTQHVSAIVDADEVRFPDADGSVELLVTQVNYSVERAGHEEYPVVHIFGRTADDTAHHVRVLGFEPYFMHQPNRLMMTYLIMMQLHGPNQDMRVSVVRN